MTRHTREQNQRGFTLIELVVVMGILALLAAIATPQVVKHFGRAKAQAARVEIKNIGVALDLFKMDVGRYPRREETLVALLKQPAGVEGWKGPYIDKKTTFRDPWGTPYSYSLVDEDYELVSYAADKAEGGTGENEDISR
jgi:general secretion pathway protein G